jgi:alpha-glucosidase (family GH31 glycosyl hydrolase)
LANFADFSVNETAFPNFKTWSQDFHKNNQKIVVIVDAGVSADSVEGYYYSQGADQGVLLRSNNGDNSTWLTQHVWPTKTVFLDFMNEQAAMIWKDGINNLYDLVNYDGLWLDMNEATGFCDGECPNGVIPNRTQTLLDGL